MAGKKLALLIDGDNISADYIPCIINEIIQNDWIITYRRIYSDWTSPQSAKWKDKLQEFSITPIQQFCNVAHKNSTDSALIIDAMDILYTGNVDGFCLVSSDSDFTRLASRLKESGMHIIGMGEKKTPQAFRNGCSVFTDIGMLYQQETLKDSYDGGEPEGQEELEELSKETLIKEIENIISVNAGKGKPTGLGEIGSRLINKYPEFDVRKYGYSLLSKFIEDIPGFKIEKDNKHHVSLNKESSIEVLEYIKTCIQNSKNQQIELGELGRVLHNKIPNFDVKDFGYSKLSTFLKNTDQFSMIDGKDYRKIVVMKVTK